MIPALARTHPNFFFIYGATTIFWTLAGVLHFGDPGRFGGPPLTKVYELLPTAAWGIICLLVAGLLFVGMFGPFVIGRMGLAVGLALALSRAFLIELVPDSEGLGVLTWGLVAALHFAQASEPTVNPAAARG